MVSKTIRFVVSFTILMAVGAIILGQGASTLTVDDVIKMVQVKLADDLVISQIKGSGKPFRLSTDEMVRLKNAGVSDEVIRAMLDPRETPASNKSLSATSTSTAERPAEGEAEKLFASLINQESGGHAKLASFRKIDGLSSEINRVPVYRIEFDATIQFTKDCKWLVALGGLGGLQFKTREAPKTTNGNFNWNDFFETTQYPGIVVKASQILGIAGTVTFLKSERGWNVSSPVDAKVVSGLDNSGRPLSPSNPTSAAPSGNKGLSESNSGKQPTANPTTKSSSEEIASLTACEDASSCIRNGKILLTKALYQEVATVWDKALKFGSPLEFQMCREGGLACAQGVFTFSKQSVSFADTKGQKVFETDLDGIVVKGVEKKKILGGHSFFRLNTRVAGKDYAFDFVPETGGCQRGRYYGCPDPVLVQQEIVAKYLAARIGSGR
jgi:hypothetical protein